jgi:PAS domain S-box-containing protein
MRGAGYEEFFNSLGDAVFLHDVQTGAIVDVNRGAMEMYGCTREELLKGTVESYSDGMPPFSLVEAQRWIRLAAEKGPQVFEWLAKRHDGRRFWVEVSLRRCQLDGKDFVLALARDISRRKDAIENARLERERAETYLRLADVIILSLDCEGRVTMINRKGQELLGLPEERILGRNWFEGFVPADVREENLAAFREFLGNRQIASCERSIQSARGERRLIFWRDMVLCDRDGNAVGTLSSGEDITERHRLEQGWRESEQRFELLMQHTQDGIGMCERIAQVMPDGKRRYRRKLVFCNDRYAEMAGRSREELLACDDLAQFTRFAGTPVQQAEYRQRRDAGFPYGGVSSWVRPDNAENYFEWLSVPVQLGTRSFSLEIDRDISERRRTEHELLLRSSALEATANGVVIAAIDGHILWVNPAFTQLTGYSCGDVIGQNMRIMKSGRHGREFYQQLWETILSGRVWQVEVINKRKDDSLYTEEMTITPVYGPSGGITHFIAIKQDVSEHRRMEDQLRQSNKMEAIGRLAGGVAHDFNNILTAIMGYNEIMLRQLPQFDPLRREAGEIEKAAYRAAQLTRQLLAFSRKQTVQPTILNLNQVITHISRMLHRLLGEDINLNLKLIDPLDSINADPSQIEQVILNLAVNARDAMSKGGSLTIATDNVTLDEIYVREHIDAKPGKQVCLTVTDTGCGMTDNVKAHLFEPFFTTKEQGRGTGLGLATCYGIVKQTEGHITVESEPNRGTTIRVFFPRVDGVAATIPSRDHSAVLPRGTESLLLVEDEPILRELVSTVLREQGYNILVASNGVEALRLLNERPEFCPQLIITDVVMPQMGGRDLVIKLRQVTPKLKVLYVSGYTPEAILQEGLPENDTAFLQKPFTPTTLVRKVRAVLDAV